MTKIYVSTTFYGSNGSLVSDACLALADCPIDGIELGSTHAYLDSAELKRLKLFLNGKDLDLVTHNFFPAHLDKMFVINLASPDTTIRNESIKHCSYCLMIAAELGAQAYTVHPGFLSSSARPSMKAGRNFDFDFAGGGTTLRDGFKYLTDSLNTLEKASREYGVELCLETEGSNTKPGFMLLETPSQIMSILAEFPSIRLNFNLAHSWFASREYQFDLIELIKAVGDKISLVEVSHNDGFADQHLTLEANSYLLQFLGAVPDVPRILEFRESSIADVKKSIQILRET